MNYELYILWGLALLYGCLDYGLDYYRNKRYREKRQPKELEITKVNRLIDNILYK